MDIPNAFGDHIWAVLSQKRDQVRNQQNFTEEIETSGYQQYISNVYPVIA